MLSIAFVEVPDQETVTCSYLRWSLKGELTMEEGDVIEQGQLSPMLRDHPAS